VIRVLVVDDQPVVASVHRQMVDKVRDFRTVALAHDGRTALARAARGDIDLVLLDLTMPGVDGLEVCRRLQAFPDPPDVIVITAIREMGTVRSALRCGAALYIVKPFTFVTLQERLAHYASFRTAATAQDTVDQQEIDQALATLRLPVPAPVPKCLSPESLESVHGVLQDSVDGLTAAEVAERTGMARVTARRYLEHLVTAGTCLREPVYGRTGRPLLRYRIRP
jgi:response regulator of citrate/malate metabolism